ncbi:MAG: hypothetical protein EA398_04590 [Deltaproteobacteria bacterium]|nr:MAG: hypothetical protein EA398_04590 [Deltaproteobacteria bacterium]
MSTARPAIGLLLLALGTLLTIPHPGAVLATELPRDARHIPPDPPTDPDRHEPDDTRRFGWIVLPSAFYAPETRFGGGIAGAVFFRPAAAGPDSRLSQVAATANYTQLRQTIIGVLPEVYLARDRLYLSSEVYFFIFPDRFYGIGNDTPASAEEVYITTSLQARTLGAWQLRPGLYAGLLTDLYTHRLDEAEEGGLLDTAAVPGTETGASIGAGPALLWDTRDFPAGPTRGAHVYAGLLLYQPALGSSWAYTRFTLDARAYHPLGRDHVLAFQLYGESTGGDVPYFHHPLLGGGLRLRGFLLGRYRDRQYLVTQAAWRFPIAWRFGGTVFGATGDVARRLDGFTLDRLKTAGGIGLRFALQPEDNLNLRLDLGVSSDGDVGLYVNVREAF